MSKDTLTQCRMTQGAREYVAFIPTKFARRGQVVSIDGKPGLWAVDACYAAIEGPKRTSAVETMSTIETSATHSWEHICSQPPTT